VTIPTPSSSLPSKQTPSWLALLTFLFVCYAVAAIGALSTASSLPTWYAALTKPSFNPPNWIFAPVWATLYGLMAIAAWLIWRTTQSGSRAFYRREALLLFAIQLTLNFLWTPVFFYFHHLLSGLLLIVLLWAAILFTTLRFWQLNRLAGALMLPYLAWVSFAAVLNYALFHLN
jgi:benzodiazapine receptor